MAIMCVMSDITPELNYYKQIEEISQYKDLLLATVTHDLKTPLNSLMVYTKLLQSEFANVRSAQVTEYFSIIDSNAVLLQNLIMDI